MGEFAPLHWLVVLVAVLILFGPKRLPEIGKGLGEAIREFKKALNGPSNVNEVPCKDVAQKIADGSDQSQK